MSTGPPIHPTSSIFWHKFSYDLNDIQMVYTLSTDAHIQYKTYTWQTYNQTTASAAEHNGNLNVI